MTRVEHETMRLMLRGGLALAVVVFGLQQPALAQLSGASVSSSGSNCTGANNTSGFCGFGAAVQTSTGSTFATRYEWNINADVGAGSTRDTSGTAQHSLSFTATAIGGYQLSIATSRLGDMNRVNDVLNCSGVSDVNAVTGTSNISLTSGTLSLVDPGAIGSGTSTTSVPYSQASSATICRSSGGVGQSHSLTFTWAGSVRSNSCEAAVRQGAQNGTTSGCSACGYAGSPARTQATDGHFVTVTFTALCGNGVLDSCAGEQCDQGAGNGSSTSCCNSNCTFRTAGATCRPVAGGCDTPETCAGASGACPADTFLSTASVCRAAAGVCDNAENCPGNSANCPADGFKPTSAGCRGSAGACDLVEACPGNGPNCTADTFVPSTTVCRASTGGCDPAENCPGTAAACPADVLSPSTTVCRAAAGPCDSAENCTGASASCPANGFQASTVVCRPSAGSCDVAENCPGNAVACPADGFEPTTTVCRASAGACDAAENCPGNAASCPADALSPSTAVCRPVAGACDVAESCTGIDADCPTDGFEPSTTECRAVAGDCDVAESCTGTGAACPADGFEPSTLLCRASVGVCDPAEHCTGSSATCSADAKEPTTTICRAAADLCDAAEQCDGVGDDCPADGFASAATVCRPAAGECDTPDTCTGSGPACPAADQKDVAGTPCTDDGNPCTADECDGVGDLCTHPAGNLGALCRAVAGVCDAPEVCDGANTSCPADSVAGAFVECRASAGECDPAETCDGAGVNCPADAKSATDTPCTDDGNACSRDVCNGSGNACTHPAGNAGATCRPVAGECDVAETCSGSNLNCPADGFLSNNTACTDDGNPCTRDKCNGSGPLCTHPAGNANAVCRPSAGVCDVVELCDGANATCPVDAVAAASVECRADAGQCDVAEHCDGGNVACPADAFELDGTPCLDGNACTLDTCQSGICVGVPDFDICLDEFLCYKAVNTKGTPKLPVLSGVNALNLADQFEMASFDADIHKTFCTPANKNDVPILDPNTHLRGRLMRANPATPLFVRRTGVQVSNQFGPFTVDVIRRDELLTPAHKSLLPPPPPAPDPQTHQVDHYKCYKVKRTGSKFVPLTVTIEDQFRSPAGTFNVIKPKRLCNPVDKNGEGIQEPSRHLVCYKVKPAVGTPLFVRRNAVQVTTQFGSESVDVIKEMELCIPSEKLL